MNMQSLLQIGIYLQIIGTGRTGAIVAGVVGLISIIIGRLAIARAVGSRTGSGRLGAILALVMGVLGTVLGALHLATTTGGFGTGNGRAGAIVAIVIGLTGTVLGWRALARFRRIDIGGSKS